MKTKLAYIMATVVWIAFLMACLPSRAQQKATQLEPPVSTTSRDDVPLRSNTRLAAEGHRKGIVEQAKSADNDTGDDSIVIQTVARHLSVVRGPVNGARLQANGKTLAVYGDPRENPPLAARVLLTHFRRDVDWAAHKLIEEGATAIIPEKEAHLFLQAKNFWERFEQARFHNYSQASTKVLAESIPAAETVRPGETFTWEGIPIRVLATPGYTAGAVTYLLRLGGKTIAFTGDLIYGDGKILDLYSFQDAIPEANIGGYHGYAARLAELLGSLRLLLAEKPDLLVPARGPVIEHPSEAIASLTERVESLYSNYLSIDALRWYFGDGHILTKAKRVLGADAPIDWMPMGETRPLPAYVTAIANARLIRSADGAGFLVDCGSKQILDRLREFRRAGDLVSLDHVFITHYHDDHTDQVPAVVNAFGSTVYACAELWDIYEKPGDYSLPCLTRNPIFVSARLSSGARWRWNEFDMSACFFPGQTMHHQALLVQKDGGESIFFIGDSFTPSGIDDYCLQNRNLLHPDFGYFKCLNMLKTLPKGCWLVNQHVEPMFRFTPQQVERMLATLRQRVEILRSLFPWDDPNYGLDECWARLHPYGLEADKEKPFSCRAVILNHSPTTQCFGVRLHLPDGWTVTGPSPDTVWIPARQEGAVGFTVLPSPDVQPGLYVITADVETHQGTFREWIEAMVRITR